MKNYKQFIISTVPFNPDILSALLWEFEIRGITENESSLTVYSENTSTLTAAKLNVFLSELQTQSLFSEFNIQTSIFEDKDWNEEWEKKTKVIEVTDRIVIKPTFREYAKVENKIIIQIDPKMSFGTGEHQTTRMMLILLEKHIKSNQKILDVGTGTGILAIACSLLTKSKSILAIDNDEWCILNSKENIAINKLQDSIKIKLAEISQIQENEFDLITANINKNVLLQIVENLNGKLSASGTLIISGIYKGDSQQVESHFCKHGFNIIEQYSIDEWASLVFTKN